MSSNKCWCAGEHTHEAKPHRHSQSQPLTLNHPSPTPSHQYKGIKIIIWLNYRCAQ